MMQRNRTTSGTRATTARAVSGPHSSSAARLMRLRTTSAGLPRANAEAANSPTAPVHQASAAGNAEQAHTPMPIDVNRANASNVPAPQSQTPITPVVLNSGEVLSSAEFRIMRTELAAARRNGEFPATRLSSHCADAVAEDYEQLQRLRQLRGDPAQPPSDQYYSEFVETARKTQQRDAEAEDDLRVQRAHENVRNMVINQNVGADLHGIIQHAAASAIDRALANNQAQSLHGNVVREIVQATLQNMDAQGAVGVQALDMDAVLEDVITVVEAAALDAAGPLRLNVNRMDGQINRMDQALEGHLENLSTQLGAMNNHVSAVGNHVNALGAFMQTINNTATATNHQMTSMSDQVRNTQTNAQAIINMIPALVEEAIQQALPGALQTILAPVLAAAIQSGAVNGKGFGVNVTSEKGTSEVSKKPKKRGFFSRIFKRHCKKDDRNGGGSPPSMAC
ncbi:uncharacterized protein JN550_005611 [Neoarthrinium moseri]|uniref:uncharacterized protein n=1 Tax=Neoarthrinium moseri TaxID=1658444 RepID=UPI001FDB6057|nr:uncharacterized protein JN550_005611 [Neoarthrinium moseri]KAI1870021.1 hypothetical protein JN550_005611 [Neoarthrinium moseri]